VDMSEMINGRLTHTHKAFSVLFFVLFSRFVYTLEGRERVMDST
jgi:hypothetical protein